MRFIADGNDHADREYGRIETLSQGGNFASDFNGFRQILHFKEWIAGHILREYIGRKTAVGVHNFVLGGTESIRYALIRGIDYDVSESKELSSTVLEW
jgi:hypothetical protein